MDTPRDHFFIYSLSVLAFCFFQILYEMYHWQFWIALIISFVMINPDLIDRLIKDHRNFISHSALLPIIIYWGWHEYWRMSDITLELGVVLFYPVLIHLVADFYSLWKKLQGYATISCFGKRMNDTQSKLYVFVNIICITLYMVWVV